MKFPLFLLLGFLLVGSQSLLAQRWTVSPFAGYRFGGTMNNSVTGNDVKIDDNLSYGIELDIDPMDSGLKLALLYSHQDTEASVDGYTPSGGRIDLDVDEFMVGAIQELYDDKFRPFVGAYVGGTYLRPSGFDSSLRFGFGATIGMNYYITKYLGVRVDLRGFGTLVSSDTGFLCANGNCLVNWSGDVLWQGEVAGSVFVTF